MPQGFYYQRYHVEVTEKFKQEYGDNTLRKADNELESRLDQSGLGRLRNNFYEQVKNGFGPKGMSVKGRLDGLDNRKKSVGDFTVEFDFLVHEGKGR